MLCLLFGWCFVLTGIWTTQYDLNMRWRSSIIGQWLIHTYTLPLFVMYFYPTSPDTLVPSISTTRGHPLTRAPPVSVPASLPTAWGHSPTRASPISVLALQLTLCITTSLCLLLNNYLYLSPPPPSLLWGS